MFISVYREGGS